MPSGIATQSLCLNDLEVGHHPHVFVFEFVAVQEIQAAVRIEANEHLNGLAVLQENRVLPSPFPRKQHPAPAAARLYLEGSAVHVGGMRGITAGREAPQLGLAEGDLKVDPGRCPRSRR